MMNPKISLIVPVYNVRHYLEACLQSLKNQTLQDIQVVCVDDGSSDGSAELLDELVRDDNRFVVVHQQNAGVAHARNVALKKATGDYILFVDSDDYLAEETCELLYRNARETKAEIVVFGGKTFPTMTWADNSFAQRKKVYKGQSFDALFYEAGSNPLMCNKLYARSFLKEQKLSFNEDLMLGEDNAFQFLAFPSASVVSFLPDTLYFYRGRPNSAVLSVKDNHAKKLWLHFDVVKYVLSEWQQKGYAAGHEKEILTWAIVFLYEDASQTPYNERQKFSSQFAPLIQDFLGSNTFNCLVEEARVREYFDFLCCKGASETPLYSVVIDPKTRGDCLVRALESLALQTEIRVEYLIMPPRDGEELAAPIKDFIAQDARAKVLNGRDVECVLSELRGRFVLTTTGAAFYEPSLLAQAQVLGLGSTEASEDALLSAQDASLASALPDVLSFADTSGFLRAADQFDFAQPSTTSLAGELPVLSSLMMGKQFYATTSLFVDNKLVSKDACVTFAQSQTVTDWQTLVLASLAQVQRVVFTKDAFVTLMSAELEEGASRTQGALLISKRLNDLSEAIIPKHAEELGLAEASALLLLVHLKLVGEGSFGAIAYQECRDYLLAKEHLDSEVFSEREYAELDSLLHDSYEEYTSKRNRTTIQALIDLNRKNAAEARAQEKAVQGLIQDIELFYSSLSYRAGRAVTLVPRKLVGAIKHVLGK